MSHEGADSLEPDAVLNLKRSHVQARYEAGTAGESTAAARQDGHVSGIVKRYSKCQSASARPMAMGWIKRTYGGAIEYAGITKDIRGAGLMMAALLGTMIGAAGVYGAYTMLPDRGWFSLVLSCITLLFTLGFTAYSYLWMGRLELFRPADEPTLFDRKHRKVYRIAREVQPGLKGLLRPWPLIACEYDWDLIDAEHHAALVTTGSSAYRQHELLLVVRKSADDPTIVDGFRVGNAFTMNDAIADAVWEHIRRFMEEGGPHLPTPDEPLADATPPTTWRDSMEAINSPFGPNYLRFWRRRPFIALFAHIGFPVLLPMTLLWATGNWLSYKTAIPIRWPQEVIDAVGPATRDGASAQRR